jgi:hypothetical protein
VRLTRKAIGSALSVGTAGVLLSLSATILSAPVRAADSLPPIKHVWFVLLENQSYTAFDDPHLSVLKQQGAWIQNYFGIAHESLPNYIALIGGQAPTPQTQQDCNPYTDISPGSPSADGQVMGTGCVYPASRLTLADQLMQNHLTWKGYMEDLNIDNDPNRDPPMTCNPPGPQGRTDNTQTGSTDQYAARHDPFMYFHSIIDSPVCKKDVVQLQDKNVGLAHDLRSVSTTPNFSFVTPNLCNDGHDPSNPYTQSGRCAAPDACGNQDGGLKSIGCWLNIYVPKITGSAAFGKDGMLVILFDESTTGDTTFCCGEQPGPNTANPGIAPASANSASPGVAGGGGQVGAVVLSPFVKPGTVASGSYNHYSLLRTVEDIFHTTGGDDGQGHLGYAGTYGIYDPGRFGGDVFTAPPPAAGQATPGSLPRVEPSPAGPLAPGVVAFGPTPLGATTGPAATPQVAGDTSSPLPAPAWNAGALAARADSAWWKGPAALVLGLMVLFGLGLAGAMAGFGRAG